MKKLAFKEIKDILIGCIILSPGVGGDLNKGLHLVKEGWEDNLKYKLSF